MATIPAHVAQPERRRIYLAAAVALIAELGVFAGAFVMLTHKQAPPPEPPVTMLSLAPAPAAQPAAPQPVAPTPPRPQPPVRPATPVHHVEHVVTPRPARRAPAPPPPTPTPAPVMPSVAPTEAPPAPRPPPPAPAAVPAAPAAPSASFESALRAAIQAALQYPESARMAGIAGRTRVAFQYRDGVVSDVKVVVSSGVGLLDRAALAAVRDAACPKPDPAFAGKTLSEQLWVTFNLNEHE